MIRIQGDYTPLMQRAAAAAFELLSLQGRAVIEVVFAGPDQIKQINKEMRNVDSVTDVLSFPMIGKVMPFYKRNYPYEYAAESHGVEIGSIVICPERAEEQAAEYGHGVDREMTYLFVHGLLHVLGYDHMTEKDKAVMREKEEEIMNKLKLARAER